MLLCGGISTEHKISIISKIIENKNIDRTLVGSGLPPRTKNQVGMLPRRRNPSAADFDLESRVFNMGSDSDDTQENKETITTV